MFKKYIYVLLLLLFIFINCSVSKRYISDTDYEHMPALYDLDDYDSCLNKKNGVYCVFRADLTAEPDNELMNLIKNYSKATQKHYDHSYIQRGICVEETCKHFVRDRSLNESADLTYILGECLNATIFQNYGLQSKLSQLYYCDRNDVKSEIDVLDWCVAGLFIVIVLVNFIGSLYDYILKNNRDEKDQGNKYMLSFSVMRNWEWLTKLECENPKLRRLKGFYGARTITNIFMVLGHTMFLIGSPFTDRPHEFEKSYDDSSHAILYNGLIIIQIFFTISGFLLTYNYLVRAENVSKIVKWKTIPMIIFLRWCRLTPALAVMIAFTITWFRHLGSGPLWNLYVGGFIASDCRKYWWSHLLYFNNYIPDDKACATQTWYVASDTQLFLMGLIILVATVPRDRIVVLAVITVISLIPPAFHVWLHDLEAAMSFTPETWRAFNNDTFFYLHICGHNNITSYAVGMITSVLIYNWQNKGVNTFKSKLFKTLFWLVIPGLIAVIYSSVLFNTDGERTPLVLRMLYQPLHRLLISIMAAFFIVGLVMKCEVTLRNIMEWRGWVVPSKLTYSVYLLHFNLIFITAGVRHKLMPMSFWYLLIYFLGITTLTYIISVPYFLMVEAPLNRLMKNVTSKMTTDPSKNIEDNKV